MMKVLRILASIVLVLLGLAVAFALVVKAVNPSFDLVYFLEGTNYLGPPFERIKAFVWAILFTVSSWAMIVSMLGSENRGEYLTLDSEEGTTRVSISALEGYIRRSVDQMGEIFPQKVRIQLKGQQFAVRLDCSVVEGRNVKNANSLVRQRIENLVVSGLGLPMPRSIEVNVHGFKEAPRDKANVAEGS